MQSASRDRDIACFDAEDPTHFAPSVASDRGMLDAAPVREGIETMRNRGESRIGTPFQGRPNIPRLVGADHAPGVRMWRIVEAESAAGTPSGAAGKDELSDRGGPIMHEMSGGRFSRIVACRGGRTDTEPHRRVIGTGLPH